MPVPNTKTVSGLGQRLHNSFKAAASSVPVYALWVRSSKLVDIKV
ncbi:hypothetical protein R2A130_0898 [Ahrensia sp. R2A130]|nr:hypothetical protein R2A130_0898 [Ahrensia sp. R2A130]